MGIAKVRVAAQSVVKKELDYYAKNGEFAHRSELGLPAYSASGCNTNCTIPGLFGADLEQYIEFIQVYWSTQSYCSQNISIHVKFNDSLIGSTLWYRHFYYSIDDVIMNNCILDGAADSGLSDCETNYTLINSRRAAACQ